MKIFRLFFSLCIVGAMAICATSCGSDEPDEPKPGTGTENNGGEGQGGGSSSYEKLILGEWYQSGYGYEYCLAFNADGTGYEYETDGNDSYKDYMIWSISGSKLFIKWIEEPDDAYWVTIVRLTADELWLEDDGEIEMYTRRRGGSQGGSGTGGQYADSPIKGTWKGTVDGWDVVIILNADGTASENCMGDYEVGTFAYSGNRLTWNVEGLLGNTFGTNIVVKSINATTMVLTDSMGWETATFKKQ